MLIAASREEKITLRGYHCHHAGGRPSSQPGGATGGDGGEGRDQRGNDGPGHHGKPLGGEVQSLPQEDEAGG